VSIFFRRSPLPSSIPMAEPTIDFLLSLLEDSGPDPFQPTGSVPSGGGDAFPQGGAAPRGGMSTCGPPEDLHTKWQLPPSAFEDPPVPNLLWTPRLDLPISVCTRAFFETNLIDYDVKITDGFYDPGRCWGTLPTVRYVLSHPEFAARSRETIVVDTVTDVPLRRFVERCAVLLGSARTPEAKAHMLAVMVSNFQGGWNTDLLPRSDRFVQALRRQIGFNVVPIGQVQHGVCRHRAVLFKFLCDSFDLPCRLIRGNYHYNTGDKEGHSWNVVLLSGKHFLCDVMHDPGMLYDITSKKIAAYCRDMKSSGRITPAGPGLDSLPIPHTVAVAVPTPDRPPVRPAARTPDATPADILHHVERIQGECERLLIVHEANEGLTRQVASLTEELRVKDRQLERLAQMLLKLNPDAGW
jgi:hypothetical protein